MLIKDFDFHILSIAHDELHYYEETFTKKKIRVNCMAKLYSSRTLGCKRRTIKMEEYDSESTLSR